MNTISEEQLAEMRRLKDSGLAYVQVANAMNIPESTVYYRLNPEKVKNFNSHKKKKRAISKPVPTPVTDSKQFVLKVSGVKVTLNLPPHMSTEAEIGDEGIIFNIL